MNAGDPHPNPVGGPFADEVGPLIDPSDASPASGDRSFVVEVDRSVVVDARAGRTFPSATGSSIAQVAQAAFGFEHEVPMQPVPAMLQEDEPSDGGPLFHVSLSRPGLGFRVSRQAAIGPIPIDAPSSS